MKRSLTVTIQPEDLQAVLAFYLRHRWLWRKALMLAVRTGAVFFIVLFALRAASITTQPLSWPSILSDAALGLAIGCATSGAMYLYSYLQIPRVVTAIFEGDESVALPATYGFDETWFTVSNEDERHALAWTNIPYWSELDDQIVIHEGTGPNYIIPKRQVPVDTLRDLRAVIRDASVMPL